MGNGFGVICVLYAIQAGGNHEYVIADVGSARDGNMPLRENSKDLVGLRRIPRPPATSSAEAGAKIHVGVVWSEIRAPHHQVLAPFPRGHLDIRKRGEIITNHNSDKE